MPESELEWPWVSYCLCGFVQNRYKHFRDQGLELACFDLFKEKFNSMSFAMLVWFTHKRLFLKLSDPMKVSILARQTEKELSGDLNVNKKRNQAW